VGCNKEEWRKQDTTSAIQVVERAIVVHAGVVALGVLSFAAVTPLLGVMLFVAVAKVLVVLWLVASLQFVALLQFVAFLPCGA